MRFWWSHLRYRSATVILCHKSGALLETKSVALSLDIYCANPSGDEVSNP